MSEQAQQTPLTDLLRDIPEDARLSYFCDPGYMLIPVGKLAREAADKIEELEAENAKLRAENVTDLVRALLFSAVTKDDDTPVH